MLVVVALGGNALLQRGETADEHVQRRHAADAARSLAPLAAQHQLVVCHGNGPQIGVLALESENDHLLSRGYPLDSLGAMTQGLIGYWLVQELLNAGAPPPVAGLLTQTIVDRGDPAFSSPSKPIGPMYDESQAREKAQQHGWHVGPDGAGWRRMASSPSPTAVVEEAVIAQLVASGATVVCGGGGGIPVARRGRQLNGVEAVIDKDHTAAVLAARLQADAFIVLTDVDGVMADYGTPQQRLLTQLTLDQVEATDYPAGSMGPKVQACADFVRATGRVAAIGALGEAMDLLSGSAGTRIVSGLPAAGHATRASEA